MPEEISPFVHKLNNLTASREQFEIAISFQHLVQNAVHFFCPSQDASSARVQVLVKKYPFEFISAVKFFPATISLAVIYSILDL